MRFHHSFWGNGSGGFGLGLWRTKTPNYVLYSIAIGPATFYILITIKVKASVNQVIHAGGGK